MIWTETCGLEEALQFCRWAAGEDDPEPPKPEDKPIDYLHKIYWALAHLLEDAHPVTIDSPQVSALPTLPYTPQEKEQFLFNLHLPFDPLWIGIDPWYGFGHEVTPVDIARLQGFLVSHHLSQHGLGIAPWYRIQEEDGHWTEPAILGWVHTDDPSRDDYEAGKMLIRVSPKAESWLDEASDRPSREDVADSLMADAHLALEILYFLESSNVILEEKEVTRQVRRHAARKGRKISLTVKIKQGPKAKPIPRGGHVHYSHRFEVRGHYKHHGEGTPVFKNNPNRVINDPTHGTCVRIWCPPFVKGPTDRPLIPKTRHMEDDDE